MFSSSLVSVMLPVQQFLSKPLPNTLWFAKYNKLGFSCPHPLRVALVGPPGSKGQNGSSSYKVELRKDAKWSTVRAHHILQQKGLLMVTLSAE